MDFDLKISFGRAASTNYGPAVQIARQFTDFCSASESDPKTTVTITDKTLKADIELIEPLWTLVGGWKSAELSLNGRKLVKVELNRLLATLRCYRDYHNAVIQQFHCRSYKHFPGWHCKQLRAVMRHHIVGPDDYSKRILWYQAGHFVTDTVWKIDKIEIGRLLQREARLKYLSICPFFDLQKAKKVIDTLPDEIDLDQVEGWEKDYLEEPGLEPRLIGIRPKFDSPQSFGGCYEQIDFEDMMGDGFE